MLKNFFHPVDKSRMVRLENPALRKKCGNALADIAQTIEVIEIPEKLIANLRKVRHFLNS